MAGQLFANGKVFTGTGPAAFADAFQVTDGRFSWVGAMKGVPPGAVDLGGRTVLPGLIDIHTHPAFMATLARSVPLHPPAVTTLASMLDQLRAHPSLGKGADAWIEGHGYNESRYPEGGPTRADLDRVSTTQPVFVRRSDGHTAVVNSRALEIAGITRETPDPPGARYARGPDGEPTGLLVEMAAVEHVHGFVPAPSREQQIQDIVAVGEHLLRFGIVAVNDLLATFMAGPLELFRDAEAAGFLPQCVLFHGLDALPQVDAGARSGRIKVGGVKLFMDGVCANRTAWTMDPYPGTSDDVGMRTITDEELRRAVGWARANGLQVCIHSMGDRAIQHVLDLFEDEEPWLADLPSIRFEHSTLFSPAMIARVRGARMRFGVVSHSIFYFAEYDNYAANLSPRQARIAYPLRSFYEQVPCFAMGSDSPATAWIDCDDVFLSVKAAVVRRAYDGSDIGQHEAMSVGQALHLYTGKAAELSALEGVGVVRSGYEGSFVILDRDPFTIPADELDRVRVAETWLMGRRVYPRSPSPDVDSGEQR
jgi:predicted amidohydrolase YtcJ